MSFSERAEQEYIDAVKRALLFVQENLEENIVPAQLAHVAGFSQHHFHRIFRAVTGESCMDHIRRLRMEKAAHQLRNSGHSVSEVALDAGYTHEAFTRTFQAYFGVVPNLFKRSLVSHMVPAACGVHFQPGGFTPLTRPVAISLLVSDQLCPIHRDHAATFEEKWQGVVEFLTQFASAVYPRRFTEKIMSTEMSIDSEIQTLEQELLKTKQRLAEARRNRPPEPVSDYTFTDWNGQPVKLSELFGDKDDLILVHNMGTGCSYCTMWADGFTGLVPHLSDRASFVVASPDEPAVQKRFAEKRNWNFRMVSLAGTTFNQDMGFYDASSDWIPDMPGVSTFRKGADGQIFRIAWSPFGPGDDFCATWPLLDLLDEGAKGWEPKYNY
jgi:predicted dithiol-disulfide oxidoreductase (DUF899 family)/AraC-like DNA-binding protein